MSYPVEIYHDRELAEHMPDQWTIQDYTLCSALGVEGNYAAEELLQAVLQDRYPSVAPRVRFDSEYGCFFAHADDMDDLLLLVQIIQEKVADSSDPGATPGSMGDSPASFRL